MDSYIFQYDRGWCADLYGGTNRCTVTVGGSNNKNGQIRVLDSSGAVKNTVDKDGFTSNATNGSHKLKGILNGSCLMFYVDNALALDLEPVYDSSDTGYTAFCTYKAMRLCG